MTPLEKKLAFSQRKNYEIDFPDLFFDSNIVPNYFPDSSLVLERLTGKLKTLKKERRLERVEDLLKAMLKNNDPMASYFAILPGHSPQQFFVYTKYPALSTNALGVLKIMDHLNTSSENFDFLAFFASDLNCGLVLDVYAGNFEIHGSDEPIFEFLMW